MSFDRVSFVADARQSYLASRSDTLSATPGTVLSIPIPDWARGFVAEPTEELRFAIDEDPEPEATGQLAVGGRLKADTESTRLLNSGTDRTLRLRSTAVSPTIYLEFF